MRRTALLFGCLILVAGGCAMFEDLEANHPFASCPQDCPADDEGVCVCPPVIDCPEGGACCPDGSAPNAEGQCVAVNSQDNASTSNNAAMTNNAAASNSATDCENEATRECCADGEACCEQQQEDGLCCYPDTGELYECPGVVNNGNVDPDPVQLHDVVIVIADESRADCAANSPDGGADLFGFAAATENGTRLEGTVLAYQFGSEPGTDADLDYARQVLENSEVESLMECPEQNRVVSLGCGGGVAIGFAPGVAVDPNETIVLDVFESGPDCDDMEDTYRVSGCPVADLEGNDAESCVVHRSEIAGTIRLYVEAGQLAR